MKNFEIQDLNWDKSDGLLPCIIQHAHNHQVLMLGYMDRLALQQTVDSKQVTFFSRSKQRLWVKGETSGHFLAVEAIHTDCDLDSLLIEAIPAGPTCHLGSDSCFPAAPKLSRHTTDVLTELEARIHDRAQHKTENSYTVSLLKSGKRRIAQKVGEEGLEVALAAVAQEAEQLCEESADLLYHLLVLLKACDVSFEQVLSVLKRRASGA